MELSDALSLKLEEQKQEIINEIEINHRLNYNENKKNEDQLNYLKEKINIEEESLSINNEILEMRENVFLNNKSLLDGGYLSKSQLDNIRESYLIAKQNVSSIKKNISNIKSEILELKYKKISSPDRLKTNESILRRKVSSIEERLIDLKNQYSFIEKAPDSGFITAVQIHKGLSVSEHSPLLSIIPIDSPLEIELLVPTRSAGFIKLGDKVKIRFDSFPYQKFGMLEGKIIHVDKVLLLPNEKRIPIKTDEAMYVVKASLNSQFISAYGKKFSLKVGMIADVDIVMEKRKLFEWVLEPVLALKGKL
ncbi:HlyD family secretion protein [Vibrio chagasii]|uniref:HlyD family secretion protein n=1 Tax=Vibrio chagasii TaxID=170679 RepID=UPI0037368CF0